MDLSNLIYLLIIVLVVFSQLKSGKKKAREASTAGPDVEADSSDVDDMLRRLLEQEAVVPMYVEDEQQVSLQSSPVTKPTHVAVHSPVDTVPSSGSTSGLQEHKKNASVAIRSREELRKAILYSEIIRRKY